MPVRSRIEEIRRRVRQAPASFSFTGLAAERELAGGYKEGLRAGLEVRSRPGR